MNKKISIAILLGIMTLSVGCGNRVASTTGGAVGAGVGFAAATGNAVVTTVGAGVGAVGAGVDTVVGNTVGRFGYRGYYADDAYDYDYYY